MQQCPRFRDLLKLIQKSILRQNIYGDIYQATTTRLPTVTGEKIF